MSKVELLSTDAHSALRLAPKDQWHDCYDVGTAVVFPEEFEEVQREYPIFLRKDPETGQFYAGVMLGFSANKNLFLNEGQWSTRYIPLTLQKGPFLIGFQDQKDTHGEVESKAVIYVDTDDERLSSEAGDLLFNEQGASSSTLEAFSDILGQIHLGSEQSERFIQILTDNDLIEPFTIDIEFNDGKTLKVEGIYSVSEEKLALLSPECLHTLNKHGHLKNIFSMMSSVNNLHSLIEIRNAMLVPV